jgi:hypothetical protein
VEGRQCFKKNKRQRKLQFMQTHCFLSPTALPKPGVEKKIAILERLQKSILPIFEKKKKQDHKAYAYLHLVLTKTVHTILYNNQGLKFTLMIRWVKEQGGLH